MISKLVDHNKQLNFFEDTKTFTINFCDQDKRSSFVKNTMFRPMPDKNTLIITSLLTTESFK